MALRSPMRHLSRRSSAQIAFSSQHSATRCFSVLSRPAPSYPTHVPLAIVERGMLAIGSALGSIINPGRHDLVATLAETTSNPYFLPRLHRAMLSSTTGRRILRARPRMTSATLSVAYLRSLPPGTVGRAYAAWLDREGVTPDTRDPVRYVDDEEQAYVMQRYRESHDFYHAVTGLPVFVEGELAIKAFEAANLGLPMQVMALAAMTKLTRPARRRFLGFGRPRGGKSNDSNEGYLTWALRNGLKAEELINVYWEEELETDVKDLRARLGIDLPPDLREARRLAKVNRAAAKPANEPHEAMGGVSLLK